MAEHGQEEEQAVDIEAALRELEARMEAGDDIEAGMDGRAAPTDPADPAEAVDEAAPEVAAEAVAEAAPAEADGGGPDLDDAADSVFLRMDPEKRLGYIKRWGLEVVDKKAAEKDGQDIAVGAAKATAQQMLEGIQRGVSPDELPDGYDDLDPSDQNLILMDIRAKKEAKAMVDAELAGFRQAQAQAQGQQMLDQSAQDWAKELAVPEAAPKIREYIGQFSQEEVGLYIQQAQGGGGMFVQTVMEKVRSIADEVQKAKESAVEKPLMKSEETGGATAKPAPNLPAAAKGLIAQMESSGQFTKEQMAAATARIAEEMAV